MTSKKTTKESSPKQGKRKSSARKAASKKKVSVRGKELTQTNGKLYDNGEVEKVRRLEEILEVKKTNPYGTNDRRIFEENVSSMNLTDLQEMAVRIGVFPNGNKTILKNKLIKSFKTENLGSSSVIVERGSPKLDPRNPRHKEIIDYLNE